MKKKIKVATIILALLFAGVETTAQDKTKKAVKSKEKQEVSDMKDWPETSKKAIKEMTGKYGEPDAKTPDMMIWNNNGPWLKTIVYKQEMKHDFPVAHTDVIEQWMNLRVLPDKYDELAKYDGSITLNRTNGTISARCGSEEMNILALNLANDIINSVKSVAQARTDYSNFAMQVKKGEKPDYTRKLNFKNDPSAPDPDKPYDSDMSVGVEETGGK